MAEYVFTKIMFSPEHKEHFYKILTECEKDEVLQTVAKNYKKYNFFLDFFNRIWYNIFKDKGNCNESFRLKLRTVSFKQDIAKQENKTYLQSSRQLH